MRILVLSDTHIPRVANDLPEKIYKAIPSVDMIIHAGDFVEEELYNKLKTLKETRAVYGNMDSSAIQKALKTKEVMQVGKIRIGLIHGYGAPGDLVETVMSEFKNVNAIVFGHSHKALNIVKGGVLLFNPGSPTDTIFASSNSYGILDIDGDNINGTIVKL
jgi:uncharacterized protein